MAWQRVATKKLATAVDDLDTGSYSGKQKKFMQQMVQIFPSGTASYLQSFNNDSTTYASRESDNDGADAQSTSLSEVTAMPNSDDDISLIQYVCNISDDDKMVMSFGCDRNAAGEANVPSRRDQVWKFIETAVQATSSKIRNTQAGVDYNSDTNMLIIGSD